MFGWFFVDCVFTILVNWLTGFGEEFYRCLGVLSTVSLNYFLLTVLWFYRCLVAIFIDYVSSLFWFSVLSMLSLLN